VTENGEKIPRFDALAIRLPSAGSGFSSKGRGRERRRIHTLLSGVESGVEHLMIF
jgi:hypothetical protein